MKKAGFKVLENEWIPLTDGRKLSARIWMPDSAMKSPLPAILEYIPYRKRDDTAQRDESTYPAFAEAGYIGVRVDISGTGESDGDWNDEYSPRELADYLRHLDAADDAYAKHLRWKDEGYSDQFKALLDLGSIDPQQRLAVKLAHGCDRTCRCGGRLRELAGHLWERRESALELRSGQRAVFQPIGQMALVRTEIEMAVA